MAETVVGASPVVPIHASSLDGATRSTPMVGRAGGAALGIASMCALIAVLIAIGRPQELQATAAGVGVLSGLALLSASHRVRAQPSSSWAASQHDPYLAMAVAAGGLTALMVAGLVTGTADEVAGGAALELMGAVAGATGFLIMIRDMTPRRVLDALFLSVIASATIVLVAWAGILRLHEHGVLMVAPTASMLGPVAVDLVVVGLAVHALHLRANARGGLWLLLLSWTAVLVLRISTVLGMLTGTGTEPAIVAGVWLVSLLLLGAAGLHPHSTHAPEPVLGPFARLARPQIALLGGAVALGPVLGILGFRSEDVVLPASAVLSVLVVTYLVRLVQGRAVYEHRAHHDELTGLPNRRLFEERAAVAVAHARRTNGHAAVLFLDLDRFKNINDSLGHEAGNQLLRAVARRLVSTSRHTDTVARLGGDEFVVLLPEVADTEEATQVADDLLAHFDEAFSVSGHQVFITPSIGLAVYPHAGSDPGALVKNADTAMYRAKERGRRCVSNYDRRMNDHAHDRLAMESQLHVALEQGEMRLHYQPKIELPSGRLIGMEALLRWEHPTLGLLEPASFIPLAEESGLIVPIGEWALTEACRQTRLWNDLDLGPLMVAVNLSLRQFRQQGIEGVVARALRTTGLDPCLLELEVTESLALQEHDLIDGALRELRQFGVTCSIDDFGTGYSGLSHLTQLPVDKLKIDKAFVATIESNREAPIVVAVIALAHSLGLDVVAEGVETQLQCERLRELGCEEMQGFLFSPPLPTEAFERLLRREREATRPGSARLGLAGMRLPALQAG